MRTLDYQNGDEAHSEENARSWAHSRLPARLSRRGNSWSRLAEQFGGTFQPGQLGLTSDQVEVKCEPWTIAIDGSVESDDSPRRFTRLRALYVNADDFRFAIYPASTRNRIVDALRMRRREALLALFEKAFATTANDHTKLCQLTSNSLVRELMTLHPPLRFEAGVPTGRLRPRRISELSFVTAGLIDDARDLNRTIKLFVEVLRGLCRVGAALAEDPQTCV